jgi:hypothetical protein
MYLEGKVQTAQMSSFHDLEITVVDRQAIKPGGGRPQYTCRLVAGWPGVAELKAKKSEVKKGKAAEQELHDIAQAIDLPQEDQVLQLSVIDLAGKNGFTRLVCEVVGVV